MAWLDSWSSKGDAGQGLLQLLLLVVVEEEVWEGEMEGGRGREGERERGCWCVARWQRISAGLRPLHWTNKSAQLLKQKERNAWLAR
jgi:hypothetical protein